MSPQCRTGSLPDKKSSLLLPQGTISVDWYTTTKIQILYQIAPVKSFVAFAEILRRNTAEKSGIRKARCPLIHPVLRWSVNSTAASAKLHVKLMLIFGGKTVSSGKMA